MQPQRTLVVCFRQQSRNQAVEIISEHQKSLGTTLSSSVLLKTLVFGRHFVGIGETCGGEGVASTLHKNQVALSAPNIDPQHMPIIASDHPPWGLGCLQEFAPQL